MELRKIENIEKSGNSFFELSKQETKFDGVKTIKTDTPLFAQYELTESCNQNCFFCYNVWKGEEKQESKKHLTNNDRLKVIDKLIELEIFGLILSGGEPLLIKNIEELISKADKAKIDVTIITNGIFLTKNKCQSLFNSGLKGLQISLHSCKEDEHDKITGVKGSFIKTFENIKESLKIFGAESINVNMVATSETYHRTYDTAKLLSQIGVKNFSASSYSYSGLGKINKNAPNKTHFRILFEQLLKAKKDFDISTLISGSFPLCVLERKITSEVKSLIGNICDAGITQIVVNPKGEVRPCVSYKNIIGNVLYDDIRQIWQSNSFLQSLRQLENIPDSCKECTHLIHCCGGCRASAMEYFNKFDALHPLISD